MRLFKRVRLDLHRQRFGRSWCTPFSFSNVLYAHITNNQMTFTIGRGNDIVRPISPAHVTNTDAGNIGLHGNPTSRGPACRKENRRLVCEYGKDLGLSRL